MGCKKGCSQIIIYDLEFFMPIRHDWNQKEITEIYHKPLLRLISQALDVHREYHKMGEVQLCSLLSIKTGGCPEDCMYCPQSAHYKTETPDVPLMSLNEVKTAAQNAKEQGATRFCMGAAWREVKDDAAFERVLEMVRDVKLLGLEVCATLGMLTFEQAKRLKEAGLYAYNHNLDTSENFYDKIISTRGYADRLETLKNVRQAGITVCCGGIFGLGESDEDRISLLHTLSNLNPHPESVPINSLVRVEGTPLADQARISIWKMVRMIATTRIVLPQAMVRLSAGRLEMSDAEQALCFLAGANSIFMGEILLTTPNPELNADMKLWEELGLQPKTRRQF